MKTFDRPPSTDGALPLGEAFLRGEEVDEGEALLLDALAARRRLLGDDHPDVARTLNLLGYVAHRRGELERAKECFSEALATNRARFGPCHLEVGNSASNPALVELDAGDASAALPHARLALEVYRRLLPANHPHLPQSENLLGRILLTLARSPPR